MSVSLNGTIIPSMTTSALSRDTYSVFFRGASLLFTDQNSFLCDQGSCSNHSVKPLWFHHPSIRSRTATMITFSNSPTFRGGRVPTQTDGLNYDHEMTRAALHRNPGATAHSPLLRAASSTTAPPISVPWLLWPVHGTSSAPAADIRVASAVHAAPRSAPLPPATRARRNSLAY